MSQKEKNDYSSTLQLPRTSFSMRANLLTAEPKHQERWAAINLDHRVLDRPFPGEDFVFHDGPPYANGPIHMGHLLNKILKDLVVRSRNMAGTKVYYVPGWDCHGLPIEHKVLKELGGHARDLNTLDVRHECKEYAANYVGLQAAQMKRLGTMADYGNPYVTMDRKYEAAVLEVFASLLEQGLVYRDVKPVHWSIANQTALAEAELEYYEREDTSIYVLFEVVDPGCLPQSLQLPEGEAAYLMIWTTTPWTIPANLAVAASPSAEYTLFEFTMQGKKQFALLAEELGKRILSVCAEDVISLGRCTGQELAASGAVYKHPFMEREGIVVTADYVTLEDGTGLVHTAPGHGAEDYFTGIHSGLPIYCPVLGDGTFDETVPDWLQGVDVWTGNSIVVESLQKSGHLFHAEKYKHSYPHDWRSKTPTIFRATEQWFISVDKPFGEQGMSLRSRALEAVSNQIRFVPSWGKSRLEGMLEARPDWCISRQRAWGLPIPAFLNPAGEVLLTGASVKAVIDVVRERGSDSWFEDSPERLLEQYDPDSDSDAPAWIREGGRQAIAALEKSADIFDVWFESGSSWNAVLRERGIGYPADLYLEGSDQHRGWFQLSLLPGIGVTGQSPFKTVLTHGFMVDADGRKMSKSQGNAIEVEEVLKTHGADICRWWVSSLNYTNDIKVDWEFFKTAGDEYRKVRNTIRFLLGNLQGFNPAEDRYEFKDEDAYCLDTWAMGELSKFVKSVRSGYINFNFKQVAESIFNFCNDSMSAVYLAAVKDRLYCDRQDSTRRRRTQTVLYDIAVALIRSIAPIMVHTSEEAWLALQGQEMDSDISVHLESLPEPFEWQVAPEWQSVMELRQQVLKALEEAKAKDNGIKNSLDAGVKAFVSEELHKKVLPFDGDLADLCGVSRFDLSQGDALEVQIEDLRSEPRCERSWKRDGTVKLRNDGGQLSDRDAAVVGV